MGDSRITSDLISASPKARHMLADAAYDSDDLRQLLLDRGTTPVIKPNLTR